MKRVPDNFYPKPQPAKQALLCTKMYTTVKYKLYNSENANYTTVKIELYNSEK